MYGLKLPDDTVKQMATLKLENNYLWQSFTDIYTDIFNARELKY